jgi:hypothetical protein
MFSTQRVLGLRKFRLIAHVCGVMCSTNCRRKVMDIVEHSKCQKCAKVLNLSELKDNPDGVGFVCIDSDACKEQQTKNQRNNNHE